MRRRIDSSKGWNGLAGPQAGGFAPPAATPGSVEAPAAAQDAFDAASAVAGSSALKGPTGQDRFQINAALERDLWKIRLAVQLNHLTGSVVRPGNDLRLYIDGEHAFPALLDSINQAQRSITFEMYNFTARDKTTEQIARALIAAKGRGVQVRVLLDAFGARELGPLRRNATIQSLRQQGIQVRIYSPLRDLRRFLAIHRNHRKSVVIDEDTAWIGGMNTGDRWFGPPQTEGRFHDLMLRIRGPASRDVLAGFLKAWADAKGPSVPALELTLAAAKPRGDIGIRMVEHVPGKDENIRRAFLTVIDAARERINFENSFPLADDVARALMDAARRGVEVNYVVDNHGLMGAMTAERFAALTQAGVKVYVYPGRIHTKAMAVDGEVSVFGSSNADEMSLDRDRELVAIIQDRDVTAHADRVLFRRDMQGDAHGRPTVLFGQGPKPGFRARLQQHLLNRFWPEPIR